MSRTPRGLRTTAREVKQLVDSKGIDKAAKKLKVSTGYINRLTHALKTNTLGKVIKSERGVRKWQERLKGKGKPTPPRAAPVRKEKPTTAKPAPQPKEKPAPLTLAQLVEKRSIITLETDRGEIVTILPKWRKPDKGKLDHFIKSERFDTPQEAARWLGNIGNLRAYAAVFYDDESDSWGIAVYPSESAVPEATVNAPRDTGEGDYAY